jgi:hypothetical protein
VFVLGLPCWSLWPCSYLEPVKKPSLSIGHHSQPAVEPCAQENRCCPIITSVRRRRSQSLFTPCSIAAMNTSTLAGCGAVLIDSSSCEAVVSEMGETRLMGSPSCWSSSDVHPVEVRSAPSIYRLSGLWTLSCRPPWNHWWTGGARTRARNPSCYFLHVQDQPCKTINAVRS